MTTRHRPSWTEDGSHLFIIGSGGLAALMATALLMAGPAPTATAVAPVLVTPVQPDVAAAPAVDPAAGADRIYGRVVLRDGQELTGYLRWEGREASWADLMPSTDVGGSVLAGVRYGHVSRFEPIDGSGVRVVLKSGVTTALSGLARPSGAPDFTPVSVETADGVVHPAWSAIEAVELLREPLDRVPTAERIYGTVITRSGMSFTGYVTWGADRALVDEGLDGPAGLIPFSRIAAVIRTSDEGVRVVTSSRAEVSVPIARARGARDRVITVADPSLGSVDVPFESFRELRLSRPTTPVEYADFDGGAGLYGTVRTTSGETRSSRLQWDRDEAHSWEILDGYAGGARFHVELGLIASIERRGLGARVELLDGRVFDLSASNDVNWMNKGIVVLGAYDAPQVVAWTDFERVDFQLRSGRD